MNVVIHDDDDDDDDEEGLPAAYIPLTPSCYSSLQTIDLSKSS